MAVVASTAWLTRMVLLESLPIELSDVQDVPSSSALSNEPADADSQTPPAPSDETPRAVAPSEGPDNGWTGDARSVDQPRARQRRRKTAPAPRGDRPDGDKDAERDAPAPLPQPDILEQVAIFAVGGADSGWCDLVTEHLAIDASAGVTATPPVDTRGMPVSAVPTVDDVRLCIFGMQPGQTATVDITDPAGRQQQIVVAHDGPPPPTEPGEVGAYTEVLWAGLPDDPLGTYTASIAVGDETIEADWQLVDRTTPGFLVVDTPERVGDVARRSTVRLAVAGYAPGVAVDLHVYEPTDDPATGRHRGTITIDTDSRGAGVAVLDVDDSYASGCHRVEHRPESIDPAVAPHGRLFCVR